MSRALSKRIARVVLSNCDAFEIFPPKLFHYLKYVTYVPGLMKLLAMSMMLVPPLRRLPISYGILTKRPISHDVVEGWIRPGLENPGVRRDVSKFIRGLSPSITMQVSRELPHVDKPFLLAWTPEDTSFPVSLAQRLKGILRDARIELIDDALVFVSEDQPQRLAGAIDRFVVACCSKTNRGADVAATAG